MFPTYQYNKLSSTELVQADTSQLRYKMLSVVDNLEQAKHLKNNSMPAVDRNSESNECFSITE
jgi:hypothetical protein